MPAGLVNTVRRVVRARRVARGGEPHVLGADLVEENAASARRPGAEQAQRERECKKRDPAGETKQGSDAEAFRYSLGKGLRIRHVSRNVERYASGFFL